MASLASWRFPRVWLVLLLLLSGLEVARAAPEVVVFPETGQALSDEHGFLSYWRANGGLAQFGYPITAEIREMNPADQKIYTVQWFERNRFEWHPEQAGTPHAVLLGLLGRQMTRGRQAEPAFQPVPPPADLAGRRYVAATGHTLGAPFADYWERRGGLALFGYPISEPAPERDEADGQTYLVQWFERARFEHHPELAGGEHEVLLGLLGNQIVGGAFYPDPPASTVISPLLVPPHYQNGHFAVPRTVTLPPGFRLNLFAAGLTDPRHLAVAPNGDLFVTERRENAGGVGAVKIITDRDRDGTADEIVTYVEPLAPYPHGIAFHGGHLYVALESRVIRYPYQPGDLRPRGPAETIIDGLPVGQAGALTGHRTRSLAFGPDGALYLAIGSSCDACLETNAYRAAVWRFNPDGGGGRPYAIGLRNAVAIGVDPATGLVWVAVNGRNGLGDDYPPEQLTPLREGGHYGWPACVGVDPPQPDPQFGAGQADFCARVVERALLALPPHSSPLGLAFYTGDQFPAVYRGGLFVVQHGSFPGQRSRLSGVGVRFVSTRPGKLQRGAQPFASGWINPDGQTYWGRPVAPVVGQDGALYISDDHAGAIYRLSYQG